MGLKPILVKNDSKKSTTLLSPSRIVSRPDNLEGGEETEIAAQISIPKDGGWGWIVVIAAFIIILLLDGICFSFGSLLNDISDELNIAHSLTAFINSIAVAVYFIGAPLASAFINRFGFRVCIMSGSVLSSFSLFISYFITNLVYLCIFYGFLTGLGFCLINMSAGLIVGFYFEKLRAIAVSITTCGSGVGIMTFYPMNTYLVSLAGWRTTILLHSGLIGLTFFLGMAFQPLLSFTVTKTTDDPTRTLTFLPTLSTTSVGATHSSTKSDGIKSTAAERLFSAVSNYNFPTAAAVVDDSVPTSLQPGPSTGGVSKLTLTANAPQGGLSQRHLKQVQSIISKSNIQDGTKRAIEITIHVESEKSGCCGNLCKWEKHIPQSRPMYRDDAFYDGKLQQLPVYQKSIMDMTSSKTGLEYQLAVTRTATTVDVKEQRGVFTTAARRILATMMDPKLLRKKSFLCYSFVSFLIYGGVLVPYVFIYNSNIDAGLKHEQCNLLVSVIGFSSLVGRLGLGFLSSKVHPLQVYTFSIILAGLCTLLSNISHNLYYQYFYCFLFGLFSAGSTCLRSLVLVALYGLDNLTNSTGLLLMFQGLGSLMGTPLAGALEKYFGYNVAFIVAGLLMTSGGLLLILVKILHKNEEKETKRTNRK